MFTLVAAIGPNKWVVVLEPEQDGVVQIAELVRDLAGLDAIHLFSHGSAGSLRLGTAILNQASIERYSEALECVGSALSESVTCSCMGAMSHRGRLVGHSFSNWLIARGQTSPHQWIRRAVRDWGGDWQLEANVGAINPTTLALDEGAYQINRHSARESSGANNWR